eukprot:361944-Chlamydomonas_euryale.AAC.6
MPCTWLRRTSEPTGRFGQLSVGVGRRKCEGRREAGQPACVAAFVRACKRTTAGPPRRSPRHDAYAPHAAALRPPARSPPPSLCLAPDLQAAVGHGARIAGGRRAELGLV